MCQQTCRQVYPHIHTFVWIEPLNVTQVIGQLQNLPDVCRSLVLFEWIDDFLSLKNYKTCLITMFGSQLLFMDFKKTKKLSFNPFLVHRLCLLDQNGF